MLEVNDLSRLSHPNIIKMIGTCVEGRERLIVYEYMSRGTLHTHIRGRKFGQKSLDWASRMKIAAGVANGLRYLHHEVSPPVIHGGLRLHNVLLGNEFDPKISDFGNPKAFMIDKSDVFSFGALLVEIVTGKTPKNSSGIRLDENHFSEWLKPRLEKHKKFTKLKDPKLKGDFPDQQTLKKVFQVVQNCVDFHDYARPDMRSVARAMNYFTSEPNSVAFPWEFSTKEDDDYSRDCPQIFFYDEITKATDSLASVIEHGHSEIAYKGLLYGRSVLITSQYPFLTRKRDKNLFLDVNLFRSSHPNVSSLIGYCFDQKQSFLVYEFMPMGSLCDALACVTITQPLDWATRMKIAVGIAKGLNHLHSECGVLCGNLESKIIFLDQGWNPKLRPLGFEPYVPKSSIFAPEFRANKYFSYKLDVYNFGILLLEIISGMNACDIKSGIKYLREALRGQCEVKLEESNLQGKFPKEEFEKAFELASQCVVADPDLRPEMINVMEFMDDLSSGALPVKLSVKEKGESSQPASSLINTAGPQVTSTLEEALHQVIRSLDPAIYRSVETRSSGTIVTQPGATRNNPVLFSKHQIRAATSDNLIGKGKSCDVEKGTLLQQTVAIKYPKTTERRNNFDHEVRVLSRLSHPNIINLIGCCADETERCIVYEFMPLGSLVNHFTDCKRGLAELDWDTRIKIAYGVAKGLSYLHNKADPPVIYKDLNPSKILLGNEFHPKISGFEIAESTLFDDRSTLTAENPFFCAPEYLFVGGLTSKLDVYSFGVFLLWLLVENMPVRTTKTRVYVNLDRRLFMREKDVRKLAALEMKGRFPEDMFKRAMTVASFCTELHPASRPDMRVVVRAMNYLTCDENGDWPDEFNSSSKPEQQNARKSF